MGGAASLALEGPDNLNEEQCRQLVEGTLKWEFNAEKFNELATDGLVHLTTLQKYVDDFSVPTEAPLTGDASDTDSDNGEDDGKQWEPPVKYTRKKRDSVCAQQIDYDDARKKADERKKNIAPKTPEELAFIVESIGTSILFKHLGRSEKEKIAESFELKKYSEGTNVIEQGDVGDEKTDQEFYVIETGEVDAFVKGINDGKSVAHYTRKGTFGELAIMYTQPRAATCTAMTDVVCWAIGQSVFKVDIVTMTEKKRKDYAGFLQNVKILQTMKPEERDIVADALTAEEFQNGENICEEGTKGERFYVIKSGGCVCTQKQKSSDGSVNEVPVPDGDLAEGDYFGEISLLDPNKNRQATVTATQPTEVLWIDRNTFGRVLGPITDILQRNKAVYQSVALRLLAGDSKPNNTRGNN